MKVGIIGLGFRLGYLAHVFTEVGDNFEVAGYVDPSPAGLPYMQEHGISAGQEYQSPADLIANENLDLLMIGSPNHMHLEHIKLGLEAGLKIFSEKPIVATIEQSYALAELLAEHGEDRLLVGLVLRYAPLYRDLIEARDKGELGDIASIEASEHIAPYHGAFFMRDWRRYGQYAGGFMLEKCCHDLDLYNGVMQSRPARVASFGGRRSFTPENAPDKAGANDMEVYHRKPSGWMGSDKVFDSDGDLVDFQTAIVQYENGASLCFHTNLNVPDEFRRFAVIGARGMAEGDFIRGFLKVTDARTTDRLVDKTYSNSGLSQHYGADEQMAQDVIDNVYNGTPQPVTAVNALEAGLLAMAMDEARLHNKLVDMSEIWARFDAALKRNQRVA